MLNAVKLSVIMLRGIQVYHSFTVMLSVIMLSIVRLSFTFIDMLSFMLIVFTVNVLMLGVVTVIVVTVSHFLCYAECRYSYNLILLLF
jgi:hypothetical protein